MKIAIFAIVMLMSIQMFVSQTADNCRELSGSTGPANQTVCNANPQTDTNFKCCFISYDTDAGAAIKKCDAIKNTADDIGAYEKALTNAKNIDIQCSSSSLITSLVLALSMFLLF